MKLTAGGVLALLALPAIGGAVWWLSSKREAVAAGLSSGIGEAGETFGFLNYLPPFNLFNWATTGTLPPALGWVKDGLTGAADDGTPAALTDTSAARVAALEQRYGDDWIGRFQREPGLRDAARVYLESLGL